MLELKHDPQPAEMAEEYAARDKSPRISKESDVPELKHDPQPAEMTEGYAARR